MESKSNSSGQSNSSTSGQSNTGNQGDGMNMSGLTDKLNGLQIPETLKKYSTTATNAIKGLSTTQKVIGGALLVLGATYLTRGSRGGWMKKASSLAGLAKMAKNKTKSSR